MSRRNAEALGAAFVVAASAFAFIARGVATRGTFAIDHRARRFVRSRRRKAIDIAVKPVTVTALPLVAAVSTWTLAWALGRDRRRAAALAIGLTPFVAASAGQSFTTFLPQRNPPGGVNEPSFPSGHTTGITAESLTAAYVLRREGIAPASTVAALVMWPLLTATTRLYRDRHWFTDILGGLAAGAAIACAMSATYELTSSRLDEATT